MPPLFFVSYARSDRDTYLERFILDLTDEVRRKLGEKRDESIRFWDTQDIDVGDVWPERLSNALRVSRLSLCLLSPAYFNSEYCGKEFQVFRVRHSINKAPSTARTIFPILWELPRGPLPDSVQPFQYSNDDFPSSYLDGGLRYLMKLSKYKDDYVLFVDCLASKLVEAGDATPLPELDDLDRFENIPNAFRIVSNNAAEDQTGGPSSARFVFIAASEAEIRNSRSELKSYGVHGGWYWQPYYPAVGTSAGKTAQLVATQLDFRYNELTVSADLIERLKKAEERNEVVVVLADPWTLRLPRYADLLRQYDGLTLVNCSVLVVWNDEDSETGAQKQMLQRSLSTIFRRKLILRPPAHEWDSIRSVKDLTAKLEEVLERLRMMILQLGTAGRKAESTAIVEQAKMAGIPIEDKPTLATPGAEQ